MQNKLQELTDKLYNEGLSKGQQEAESLLAKTHADIDEMLSKAKKEADQIVSAANKEAEEVKKNANAEIRLAGRQVLEQVKQSIVETLLSKTIATPTKEAFNSADFIKELIKVAVGQFSPNAEDNSVELSVLLPEDKKEQFSDFVAGSLQQVLKEGVDVQFSKLQKEGFRIGAKDSGYYINFTDSNFENLFKEYLRPTVQNLLFD